jgi:hypothetical protein
VGPRIEISVLRPTLIASIFSVASDTRDHISFGLYSRNMDVETSIVLKLLSVPFLVVRMMGSLWILTLRHESITTGGVMSS